MIVSKTIVMKWSNKIKTYYVNKGYIFTHRGDDFNVNIEDLQEGSNKPINIICDYCGKSISKPYYEIKGQRAKTESYKDCCKECAPTKQKESMIQRYGVAVASQVPEFLEKIKAGERITFSIVEEEFIKAGYELLSTSKEYQNGHTPLNYICPNHRSEGIKTMSYNNLLKGKTCKSCSNDKRSKDKRFSGDFIYSEFINKGYEPLFKPEDYINSTQELKYICPIHRDEGVKHITYSNLASGHGCHSCFADRNSGEKSYRWDPKLTDEERIMKRSYTEYYAWRKDTFERDNYICQCCGQRGGILNAHHLVNYSQDIEGRLNLDNSVTLCREEHILFHKTYGYQNNTKEQYEEFKLTQQLNIVPTQEAI